MDADIQCILVLINEFNGLLLPAIQVNFLESPELPDTMIDMHHIVPWLQTGQLPDGQAFLPCELFIQLVTVIAVKDLVVGIKTQF